MAKPLQIITQHYDYPLKPAALELCDAIGAAMVTAGPARLALLQRIYNNMNPSAKARTIFAGSVAAIGGK